MKQKFERNTGGRLNMTWYVRGILFAILLTQGTHAWARKDTIHREFDFSNRDTLSIRVDDADVIYRGRDGDMLTVEVRTEMKKIDEQGFRDYLANSKPVFRESENSLEIEIKKSSQARQHRNLWLKQVVTIEGPSSLSLDIFSADGDLEIANLNGGIKLNTQDGDVHFSNIGGDIDISSGDGDLEGETVSGAIVLRTGDGNITVENVRGSVSAKTGDGDLEIEFVQGPEAECLFKTGDGDVELFLPSYSKLRIETITGDGGVRIRELDGVVILPSNSKQRVFELNGGGPLVEIQTGDGNIQIGSR